MLNWFVPKIPKSNMIELRKANIFIMLNLFLVAFLTIFYYLPFFIPNYGEIKLNVFVAGMILFLNLISFKIWNKRRINLYILLTLTLIVFNIALQKSGGIYSDDVYWLLLIPICAILMDTTLSGIFWTVIISSNMVYFYILEINSITSYRLVTLKNNPEYYIFGSLLFYVVLFTLVYIFKRLTNKYELQLTKKQLQLEHKQKLLVEKRDILKKQAKILKATQLELTKSNEELEKYAYVTSHDLKQPLRTVKSFTRLLQKRLMAKNVLDRESNEYINFVLKSAGNMEELISTLLEYARITASKNITFIKVDLNNVMQLINENLAHQIKDANVTIICSQLPNITAIPVKINQLFQNIISNSIKFKKNGVPPIIQISARELPKYWEFRISDNGVGINDEDAKKIFLPFERTINTGAVAGSGIGLATCQKIIEFHRGSIRAISNGLNNGIEILFTIKKDLENEMYSSNSDIEKIKA